MIKKVRTKEYNYNFSLKTGLFARWGKTLKDDPQFSPLGPEIADIEISTICHGLGKPCAWCYKANTDKGENMTLKQFKMLFKKFPKNLTQIAFGIGDIYSNKDIFKIFEHTRKNNVIPNVTINGWNLLDKYADKLAKLCGAVAVSRYEPKDVCYDAVKKLTDRGMTQVNIHALVSEETYDSCFETLKDFSKDSRLKKLNAIVFLTAKQKGRGEWLTTLSMKKYKKLVNYGLDNKIKIGFDSCSANKFLKAVKTHPARKKLEQYCEPCESGIFSAYINVKGQYYSCSFTEGEKGFKPLDVMNCKDFLKDIWFHKKTIEWRKRLLKNCRNCPVFNI